MIRKLLLLVGVLILGLVVIVLVQPKNYHVERTAVIEAPPAEVFAQVNDLEAWRDWSPWEKLDPNMKVTFEGPETGEGAKMKWEGNDEVGKGTLTITESKSNELVRYRLDFEKPYTSTSMADMILKPAKDGEQTTVTWSMYGEKGFVDKAVCLVMNMDKMIGEKYEEGLANLNKVVKGETPASTDKPDTKPTTPETKPVTKPTTPEIKPTPETKPTPDTKPVTKPTTPKTKPTPETKPAPKPTTPEIKPTPDTKPAPKPTTPETKPSTKPASDQKKTEKK